MAKQSQYTLLIICEGENTEPNFFGSIRDRIMEGIYAIEKMAISIRPEPALTDISDEKESELKPKRKARKVLPAKKEIEVEITGAPPLKWVLAGQEELRLGTFNEVWVVFDDDNHPAKAEAFEKANDIIEGKRVQIAYSSIAFEYYLLLHFERINKAFEKSECRQKKIPICCSTGLHKSDCWGEKCVGGYARKLGYWENSKEKISMFPLVEDKLERGFWNAAWLRYESNRVFGEFVFYNRNPFVTTDSIVKRLTGYGAYTFAVVSYEEKFNITNEISICFQYNLSIRIVNISALSIIIPKESIARVFNDGSGNENIGDRQLLNPNEEMTIVFAPKLQDTRKSEYFFHYNYFRVMLSY